MKIKYPTMAVFILAVCFTLGAFFAVIVLLATSAHAQDTVPEHYLVTHITSHHPDPPSEDNDFDRYNEENPGIGYQISGLGKRQRVHVEAGYFRNSEYHDSFYVMAVYDYLAYRNVRVGPAIGLTTGYERYPVVGLAGIMAHVEFQRVGMKLGFVPPFDKESAVFTFGLTYRL